MGERQRGAWRGGLLCLLALAAVPLRPRDPQGVAARSPKVEEYEARAAFLLSLAKYTEWPEAALPPGEPFTIGVVGESPLVAALEGLAAAPVQGRAVVVRRFRGVADVQPCAILYFPVAEERHLAALAPKLAGRGVFTVGETSFFLGYGGILQLFNEEGRLRFVLNRAALDQAHLRLSAQVQHLAKRVIPSP